MRVPRTRRHRFINRFYRVIKNNNKKNSTFQYNPHLRSHLFFHKYISAIWPLYDSCKKNFEIHTITLRSLKMLKELDTTCVITT